MIYYNIKNLKTNNFKFFFEIILNNLKESIIILEKNYRLMKIKK